MNRFEGKVALITGAASGIGRATAIRLADEGAKVACVDRAVDGAEVTAAGIRDTGGTAVAIGCDVLDLDQIRAAVERTVAELGGLDVLCNIAGIGHFAKDEEETPEGWNRILGVNLSGTYFMSQAALPHLLTSGGNIVNCASTAGTHAQPYSSAYSASKGGVISLTQTMAITQGQHGVRVNCVAPGGVNTAITEQFPMPEDVDLSIFARIMPFKDMGEPENLAAAFAFLASDDAAYVNGIILRVDGGMKA
jgi:meso-butanediol dehydrogenase/(S,S)-butanediol dehydrogenase/diacetyl reductase